MSKDIKSNIPFKLYLDETGIPSPFASSGLPFFIFSGVIVNAFQGEHLKVKADQIKFKYWGHTNVVFHSREMGLKLNDFSILKDPQIESAFYNDLFSFLKRDHIKLIIVAVDRQKANSLDWKTRDIYEEAAKKMIESFIVFLDKKRTRGQIIIESSGMKDLSFLKKYSYYLSNGLPSISLAHADVKNLLTSVSFVSKRNLDIETQIADLLAYPAGSYCLDQDNLKKMIRPSYEDDMCKILHTKLITLNSRNSFIRIP